jgi:hypothetical protein
MQQNMQHISDQPQFQQQQRPTMAPQQFQPSQNMVPPQGGATIQMGQPRQIVPPKQMVGPSPMTAQMMPGIQQIPTQQNVPSISGAPMPQQVLPTSYQGVSQTNPQQIPNFQVAGQPNPNQPWATHQDPHMRNVHSTQPPVSSYPGNQPPTDIKPPNHDMNQQTRPLGQTYGTYGYPQQPNTVSGQAQNYQSQMVGQQGGAMSPSQGLYPKPHGQPEQYNAGNPMVRSYGQTQNNAGLNQLVQSEQQPTVYTSQPSYQAAQQQPSGSPYNQPLSWVPPQQPSQGRGQPYTPNYQGTAQSFPNQYGVSSPSVSYSNPYASNTTPYTRNVGNEYGQNHQPRQSLPPLPNFPLTGAPSDMHIKNINRILQQTGALLMQVEQFRGKRGSVLQCFLYSVAYYHGQNRGNFSYLC